MSIFFDRIKDARVKGVASALPDPHPSPRLSLSTHHRACFACSQGSAPTAAVMTSGLLADCVASWADVETGTLDEVGREAKTKREREEGGEGGGE
jgi:hypothetical protein